MRSSFKAAGFSIVEILILIAVTSLLTLGSLSLIQTFQKGVKHAGELGYLTTLSSFLKSQFTQMTPSDCLGYFPPSLNKIDLTKKKNFMTLMKESTPLSATPEIRMDAIGTTLNGNEYHLELTTTDDICRTTSFSCAGALNLVVKRTHPGFLGLKWLSAGLLLDGKGYVKSNEGFLGNLIFRVDPTGALQSCSYAGAVSRSGQIDYSTCTHYAKPAPPSSPYTPDDAHFGVTDQKVSCPTGYVGLGACGGSCGGKASSILCCRLKDQTQVTTPNTRDPTRSVPQWADFCIDGEVVTGVCNGTCSSGHMECTYVGIYQVKPLCRTVPIGNFFCPPWNVLTGYCPPGATGCGNPGNLYCCPFPP